MEACPACTASMRDALLHCDSPDCIWLKCGKCQCTIDDDGVYCRGGKLWGNPDGYLKAKS
jgi:hypothetical protein